MRIICFGAHPDDCEIQFGGTAAKFARAGHAVKFVSVTDGSAGHHLKFGPELAVIRRDEAHAAAQRLGIAGSEVLTARDGALQPTLEYRAEIIRLIREWNADLVFTHRACDYHPDHRYTSLLVQDAAYLVQVPAVCPETPPLRRNPVFLYLEDNFRQPNPFEADIAVNIDDVWPAKICAMDAHASQFYEWLPWLERTASPGQADQVPPDPEERRRWLSYTWTKPIRPATRAALNTRYGSEARGILHAEAFQVCEYGRQAARAELDEIFPH